MNDITLSSAELREAIAIEVLGCTKLVGNDPERQVWMVDHYNVHYLFDEIFPQYDTDRNMMPAVWNAIDRLGLKIPFALCIYRYAFPNKTTPGPVFVGSVESTWLYLTITPEQLCRIALHAVRDRKEAEQFYNSSLGETHVPNLKQE